MARIIITDFTTVDFGEEELLQSRILSPINKMHIRNLIAVYAEERAMLTFDHTLPNSERSFSMAMSKLGGSIEALRYLISLSDSAETELAIRSRMQTQNQ